MAKQVDQISANQPAQGVMQKLPHYFSRIGYYWREGNYILNAKLRLRSANFVGKRVRVLGRVKVSNQGGRISIHERTVVDSTTATVEISALQPGAELEIGENCYINCGTIITASRSIKIGKDCQIGFYSMLMDSDFHGVEDRNSPPPPEPIVLEDNVWLGSRVIVLKGVTIGHDSVVAAGSVVTKDVPPRCLVAGLPARIIKRF